MAARKITAAQKAAGAAGQARARGIAEATKVRPGSKIGGKKIPARTKYAISAAGGPVRVGSDHSRG